MPVVLHEHHSDYDDEYQRVRAALVARGSSLNKWLIERGISRQLAYKALKGQSLGRKAVAVRKCILADVLDVRA